MVWVQVIATEGSTYRKSGAVKLISSNGESCGLISGGCLEKEIVEKALQMSSQRETHEFSTQAETDRLFGYELGCAGKLTIEFKKSSAKEILSFLEEKKMQSELCVRVVGAGVDLNPLAELLLWTQWDVQYFTHQKDLLADRLKIGWSIHDLEKEQFLKSIPNPERTAVLLTSHNYPTDLEGLSYLVNCPVGYIGILGPETRKQQLIADLEKIHNITWPKEKQGNLYGPIGLPGLGPGEDAIALSVISQLHSCFYGSLQK